MVVYRSIGYPIPIPMEIPTSAWWDSTQPVGRVPLWYPRTHRVASSEVSSAELSPKRRGTSDHFWVGRKSSCLPMKMTIPWDIRRIRHTVTPMFFIICFIADSKHLMIEQQCSTDSQWECYRTSAKHNMTVPSAMEGSEALWFCDIQWIGLRENLQEPPRLHGKNRGFL